MLTPTLTGAKASVCLGGDAQERLVEHLRGNNFKVNNCPSGDRLIATLIRESFDAVILFSELPAIGGYEVLKQIRPQIPGFLLFMGADYSEAAQIKAYDLGADGYLCQTATPILVASCLNSGLKRNVWQKDFGKRPEIIVGDLSINENRREAFLNKRQIPLTTVQFDLLCYLAKRCGEVIPREVLHEAVFKNKFNGFDRTVDVYISRIRQLLGDCAENPLYLKTVRGVGYLFAAPLNHRHTRKAESSSRLTVTKNYRQVTQLP